MWYDDDIELQISYYGTKNIFVYGVLYLIKYKLQNADTMTANFWIKTFCQFGSECRYASKNNR